MPPSGQNDQNSVIWSKMTKKKSKITFWGAILNLGADKIKINSNIFAMKWPEIKSG